MGDDVSMGQLNDDECNAPFDWCHMVRSSCWHWRELCWRCVFQSLFVLVLLCLIVYAHISYSCQCLCSYIVWVARVGAMLAETASWARFPAIPSAEAPHPFYGYYGPVSQFRVYGVQKDDSNSCMMLHAMCSCFFGSRITRWWFQLSVFPISIKSQSFPIQLIVCFKSVSNELKVETAT